MWISCNIYNGFFVSIYITKFGDYQMKKLNIEAVLNDEGDIVFTIQRTKDLTLIEILGLLEHIKFEVAETIKKKFKMTQE